jgi:hypothetical protein
MRSGPVAWDNYFWEAGVMLKRMDNAGIVVESLIAWARAPCGEQTAKIFAAPLFRAQADK